ncbi:hypothetical protein [Streptomyces graminilatus]|uniref:hypothetical protein n=1 Tax=Streptomyces graminilatus TaxID=1464070 RepID=UPI0006E37D05|nr:hypothetical protein [Streptomyces graminilatus]
MTTSPLLPLPVLPFTPLPVPVSPSFEETKKEARAILLAGAELPLPAAVQRHQERVLDGLYNALASTGEGQRLYVLEKAGPIPRVKIGRSNDPWKRIRHHVSEMNSHQYGLIDAHVTDPVDDRLSISRAEVAAHVGMGRRYQRITREEFRDADFVIATMWAYVSVQRHQPHTDDE